MIERGRERNYAARTDLSIARLEADDSAPRGGHADAAADVGTESPGRTARRDDRRLSAAAAARRALEVPRIIRAAVERVVGFGEEQQLRNVGLAENDCAGSSYSRDVRVVNFGNVARAQREAERRRCARDVERFFDRDGDAGERSVRLASRAPGVERASFVARLVVTLDHDGIELRVDLFDPRDVRVDDVER